jgi:hypothetical protein
MDPPLKPYVETPNGLQKLHQLSRTWNMVYEDLNDLHERFELLLEAAQKLTAAGIHDTQSVTEALSFLKARNHLRRRWVTSFGERSKLIIKFVFTSLTSTIAEETLRDSQSMMT